MVAKHESVDSNDTIMSLCCLRVQHRDKNVTLRKENVEVKTEGQTIVMKYSVPKTTHLRHETIVNSRN